MSDLSKKWPYSATTIYEEEEEMLSFLLTGLSAKYNVSLNVLILQGGQNKVITPVSGRWSLPKFCTYIREDIPGGEKLCRESSFRNCVKLIKDSNLSSPTEFRCHMGLRNFYSPLNIDQYAVACCATGKICAADDVEEIEIKLYEITSNIEKSQEGHRKKLRQYLNDIIKEQDAIDIMKKNLASCADFLSQRLTEKYLSNKLSILKKRRERIETILSTIYNHNPEKWEENQEQIKNILHGICEYLGSEYLAIFLAERPHETLLDLIVQTGFNDLQKGDVHFNCKKAKIPQFSIEEWEYQTHTENVAKGIRGHSSGIFSGIAYFLPFIFAGYHGAVALGPFTRTVDVTKEKEFINQLCYTIGLRICGMRVLRTLHEKKKEKDITVALSAHMARHGLHNIWADLDEISYQIEKQPPNLSKIKIALDQANKNMESFKRRLDASLDNPTALIGIMEDVEIAHLKIEPMTVPVILGMCAERHKERAQSKRCKIIIDDSIESLPGFLGDPEVMRLAFDNLLENAIKYSSKKRSIKIHGNATLDGQQVVISISNVGLEIKKKEIPKIFKIGYRTDAAKQLSIATGHGLGLGQVKKIVELHTGRIDVTNKKIGTGNWNFLTTFNISLPSILYSPLRSKI
ncbi:MAG: ATP-binding protein [Candidatus Hodarchaeales archaeon]|jgi:signal transduction histidine kinase/ligand-binding sensor protein